MSDSIMFESIRAQARVRVVITSLVLCVVVSSLLASSAAAATRTKPATFGRARPPAERGIDIDWIGQRALPSGLSTWAEQKNEAAELMRYVKALGSNSVVISFGYGTPSPFSNILRAEAITPTIAELRMAIAEAHRFGLRVTLRPFLDQVALKKFGTSYWSGVIAPTDRGHWFASLYSLLVPYLELAQRTGVTTFVVGSELNSLIDDPHWSALIDRAKRIFRGQLSYAANWDTYATGQVGVPVHKVGLDAYPPIDVGPSASVATLTADWTNWFSQTPATLRHHTTVYEVAILATDGAYALPYAWNLRGNYNAGIQSRWFRAVCTAVRTADVPGLYFWGVTSTQSFLGEGTTDRISFVGRAGQEAIRWCFTQNSAQLELPRYVPVAITTPASVSVTFGAPISFTIRSSGEPTPTVTVDTSLLPDWLSVSYGNGTATLTGTPPVSAAGETFQVYVDAANGLEPYASQTINLTVPGMAPDITSSSTETATATSASSYAPLSFNVTATGVPAPSLAVSGLPAWLSYSAGGNGTATISGTPPASAAGQTFQIYVDATNGVSPYASQTITVTVPGIAPLITSADTETAASNSPSSYSPLSFEVTATGEPTPSLVVSGPSWLNYTDNGNGTATITGTPPASAGGQSIPIYVTAANGTSPYATQTIMLTVPGIAPNITSSSSATGMVGTAFSFTVTTTGAPTPSITVSGPSWLSYTDNGNGTATITGTPPASAGGQSIPIYVTAANGTPPYATQTIMLAVGA